MSGSPFHTNKRLLGIPDSCGRVSVHNPYRILFHRFAQSYDFASYC